MEKFNLCIETFQKPRTYATRKLIELMVVWVSNRRLGQNFFETDKLFESFSNVLNISFSIQRQSFAINTTGHID